MSFHIVQANIPLPKNDVAHVNHLIYRVHYFSRVLIGGITCEDSCMFAKCDMCMTSPGNKDTNIPTTNRSSKRRSMSLNAKAITLRKDELESKELRKWKISVFIMMITSWLSATTLKTSEKDCEQRRRPGSIFGLNDAPVAIRIFQMCRLGTYCNAL